MTAAWHLIEQPYNVMVEYATALRSGTAEAGTRASEVKEVSGGLVACSVTVLWPAAGLRCDFRNLPLKQ
ncbi:hypothetical protein ABB07_37595 [Streptomyces incarnatus]|uniref:Uncharacterized protein n=1 Tax=Streptomyces incarnatus TaxID=665007 RepID=A0ABN4GWH5_9ACTN|nr:hypothetical protein ABB07_37595 [Streptomyces incarnatus]